MRDHPQVALAFYWDRWAEQCHVEGRVEKIADTESDHYWFRRRRESRIGAWASLQSQPLPAREVLLDKCAELEEHYRDQEIPRPDHWHGFRVVPRRIEFWCGRDARLHERLVYADTDGIWTKQMLYP